MELDHSASENVDASLYTSIAQGLWKKNDTAQQGLDLRSYFKYYTTECNLAIQFSGGKYACIRSHRELMYAAEMLRDHKSKGDIEKELKKKIEQDWGAEEERSILDSSIALAARIVTMVNIGPYPNTSKWQASLDWKDSTLSLKKVLEHKFVVQPHDRQDNYELDGNFTAHKIVKWAAIEISWTDDLSEHLRLTSDRKKVCIFHHVTFLKVQSSSDVFPAGFIAETIRTLSLLFPPQDDESRAWIESIISRNSHIDPEIAKCDRLREWGPNDFVFWRRDLLTLKGVFNEPGKRSLLHHWRDKRDIAQWSTFWVAIVILCLTIFFGLVQSIEGALQVYKAYHPSK